MQRIKRYMADSRKRVLIYVLIVIGLVIILPLLGLLMFDVVRRVRGSWRYFAIDPDQNSFVMDGEPFRVISGEFHYFRAPHQSWRNILRKMRAAGLNSVSTAIEWSSHETDEGEFAFNRDNDIENFIRTASEEDLYVILRAGPYINADRDFGGLPSWLLINYPHLKIRTMDTRFVKTVENWFNELFPRIQNYFYGYGGPVIMVQIEHEYGSWNICDTAYKTWLRDTIKPHVEDAAVLYTTDKDEVSLKCGAIPGVYATISFGPNDDAEEKFAQMRNQSPNGPLFNSQLYTGYPCYWREPMKVIDSAKIKEATLNLIKMNANFNYYMFFGGTNFYFKNGANYLTKENGQKVYRAICTSYDYDAPLDEAGDYTKKYWDIRDALSDPGNSTLPDDFSPKSARKKGNYGAIRMNLRTELFWAISHIYDRIEQYSMFPDLFEEIGLKYGYVLYITQLERWFAYMVPTDFITVDRYADKYYSYTSKPFASESIRLFNRTRDIKKMPTELLGVPQGNYLRILVENQGRVSSGDIDDMNDPKGILRRPYNRGAPMTPWTMVGLPFTDMSWLWKSTARHKTDVPNYPVIYEGELVLPPQTASLDTYIDFTGWHEGSVFINNCSLGRFWANVGPQVTVFVPGSCFVVHPRKNWILLFVPWQAMDGQTKITFTDKPKLGKPTT